MSAIWLSKKTIPIHAISKILKFNQSALHSVFELYFDCFVRENVFDKIKNILEVLEIFVIVKGASKSKYKVLPFGTPLHPGYWKKFS